MNPHLSALRDTAMAAVIVQLQSKARENPYLDELERSLPARRLVAFDQAMRTNSWSLPEHCRGWTAIKASHLWGAPPPALCFLSTHRSGHVREQAVQAMGLAPRYTRWLLLRANDWVPQVANLARDKVREHLRPDWSETWLPYLYLLWSVDERRWSLKSLRQAILGMVESEPASFERFIVDPNSPIHSRRIAFELLNQAHPELALSAGARCHDVRIQGLCLRREDRPEELRRYAHASVASLRWRALHRLAKLDALSDKDLQRALVDPVGNVRDFAKRLSKDHPQPDFLAEVYRSAELTSGKLLGAVGVLPKAELEPLLEQCLQSSTSRLARAALEALVRSSKEPDELLWNQLDHQSAAVRRAAGRMLRARRSFYLGGDFLWQKRAQVPEPQKSEFLELAAASPNPYTRIRAAFQGVLEHPAGVSESEFAIAMERATAMFGPYAMDEEMWAKLELLLKQLPKKWLALAEAKLRHCIPFAK